jgi:hypothetical protein
MQLGTRGGLAVAGVVLLAGVVVAFALGRYPVTRIDLVQVLAAKLTGGPSGVPAVAETVIWQIRGPRVVAAVLVGAALSVAGTAFQGLFRNPLVSPDLLGASSGAALGTVIATDVELWNGHCEKVLGVREAWAAAYPRTHQALVQALLEACRYCEDPAHREELAELLAQSQYVGTDVATIRPGLVDAYDRGTGARGGSRETCAGCRSHRPCDTQSDRRRQGACAARRQGARRQTGGRTGRRAIHRAGGRFRRGGQGT